MQSQGGGLRASLPRGRLLPGQYLCVDGSVVSGIESEEDLEDTSLTIRPPAQKGCTNNGQVYENGADIVTEDPCEHCYCLNGDMVCAIQECMGPLEGKTDNCEALPPPPGQCCPAEYKCNPVTAPTSLPFVGETTIAANVAESTTIAADNGDSVGTVETSKNEEEIAEESTTTESKVEDVKPMETLNEEEETEESTSIVAEIEQDVAPIESSKKEESLLEDTADVNLDIQYDDADLNLDLQYDQEPLTTTEEPKVSSISQSLS